MEKTLFCVPSSSPKLFVDLAAVTSLTWTDDGVDVTLSCGGRLNVTEDVAINIADMIFKCMAAEYAAKVGGDSSGGGAGVSSDLDANDPSDGPRLLGE